MKLTLLVFGLVRTITHLCSGYREILRKLKNFNSFDFLLKKHSYIFNTYVTHTFTYVYIPLNLISQCNPHAPNPNKTHIDTIIVYPSRIHHKLSRYSLCYSDQHHPVHHHHICLSHHISIHGFTIFNFNLFYSLPFCETLSFSFGFLILLLAAAGFFFLHSLFKSASSRTSFIDGCKNFRLFLCRLMYQV